MGLPSGSLSIGSGEDCLVFVPGFMSPTAGYRSLLAPAATLVRVVVPLLTRPGPRALVGSVRPEQEAVRLEGLVAELRTSHRSVWVGGHSRGGFVAWLAVTGVAPAGLVLVDPVAGGGPPWAPPTALERRVVDAPTLVIGLGAANRCAPAGRGHESFAEAAPGCDHVTVAGAGHADVLDGWSARLGGVVCPRGEDPDGARRIVGELIARHVSAGGRR